MRNVNFSILLSKIFFSIFFLEIISFSVIEIRKVGLVADFTSSQTIKSSVH